MNDEYRVPPKMDSPIYIALKSSVKRLQPVLLITSRRYKGFYYAMRACAPA